MKIYMSPLGNWYTPEGFSALDESDTVKETDFYFSTKCTSNVQVLKPAGGFSGSRMANISASFNVKIIRKVKENTDSDLLDELDKPVPATPIPLRERYIDVESGRIYEKLDASDIFKQGCFFVAKDKHPCPTAEYQWNYSWILKPVVRALADLNEAALIGAAIWRLVSTPMDTSAPEIATATISSASLTTGVIKRGSFARAVPKLCTSGESGSIESIEFDSKDLMFLDDDDVVKPRDISISPSFTCRNSALEYAFKHKYENSTWGEKEYLTCIGGFGGLGDGNYRAGQIKKRLGGGSVVRWMALHRDKPKRMVSRRVIEPLPLP